MKWKPYPKYKESGVEWLGEVPEEWGITQVKRLTCKIGSGKTPSGGSQVYSDEGVTFLRSQNVHDDGLRLDDVVFISTQIDRELQASRVRPGDILLNITGASLGRTCFVPHGIGRANVNQHVCLIRLLDLALVPFIAYAFKSCLVQSQIAGEQNGAARDGLNYEQVGNLFLALPSQEDGEKTAHFLDRETAKIDTLIAKQERLIELLQEKRQALISHAVTKGLNPDAPMKPSGVEWLGDVPTHWHVGAVKRFARLESGHTPSRLHPEYWENCTIPWFTLADVWQLRDDRVETVVETKELVSEFGLANSSARLLPAGTVMLSRTASVGFSGIMGVPMATTQDFANWVCKSDVIPKYVLYGLRAMRSDFDKFMYGSTHNTIYMPDIQKLQICLPPLAEQVEIVRWIRSQIGMIDGLVGKAHRSIALMREHRTALISAAVTGKIDVRESTHA